MKMILARSATCDSDFGDAVREQLLQNEIQMQPLDLAPIDEGNPLRALACWRLLPLAGMADVLLCIDACSAVLRHPRKVVWLPNGLNFIESGPPTYVAKVLLAGIGEAETVFAPGASLAKLKSAGLRRVKPLDASLFGSRSSKDRSRFIKALRG